MSRREAQSWLCSKLGVFLPYYSMGKVDSYDLFGPNELVLFAFYEKNKARIIPQQAEYNRVRETVLGELQKAKRFTKDVNDAYAQFVAAFYT